MVEAYVASGTFSRVFRVREGGAPAAKESEAAKVCVSVGGSDVGDLHGAAIGVAIS